MTRAIENTINFAIRYLNKPFWRASEYFLSRDCGWQAVAYKVGGVVLGIITCPLAILAETIDFLSQLYYRRPYLTYRGADQNIEGRPKKLLTFNVCMMRGGLPMIFGGMRPFSQRIDQLAQVLKEQDADIICLQEIDFDPSVELIARIKSNYSYFYYRIGPHPFRMNSALFWASKYPLKQPPEFIAFNVEGMQWGFRRGFFMGELEDRIVILTHLDRGLKQGEVRIKQIKKIIEYIQNKNFQKPLFLMGDFNIDSTDQKAQQLLETHFYNFNQPATSHPTQENATCYKNCPNKPPTWAVFDHILISYKGADTKVKRILAFDPNNLSHALSDHHGVVVTQV